MSAQFEKAAAHRKTEAGAASRYQDALTLQKIGLEHRNPFFLDARSIPAGSTANTVGRGRPEFTTVRL
jgi:hypothetical protein